MGRKLLKPRPVQGEHLRRLREAAGLSQRELARLIGEPPQNVAYWEQAEKPPRGEVLPRLAGALGVRIEELLNVAGAVARPAGPAGKLRKVFEDVAALPRRQQAKVVEFVAAFVFQYKQGQKS